MSTIAVILYLYHTDLWDEFKKLLGPFKQDIRLYLCLCADNDNSSVEQEVSAIFDCKLSYYNNYGADVASFLNVLKTVEEKYFIKIHSKKSLYGKFNQINWRQILLNDFFNNKILFTNNYLNLNKEKTGAVGSKNMLLNNRELQHSDKIRYLCDILHIKYEEVKNSYFFGGNMFMSHTHLFQEYFVPYNKTLQNLLSNEKNKVVELPEGTFSHALERIFGYIIPYNDLIFQHPSHKIIRISNQQAPNEYFNMIIMYNNDCYLEEDMHVYGHIIDNSIDNFSIEWYHVKPISITKYSFLDEHTIVQKQFDTGS